MRFIYTLSRYLVGLLFIFSGLIKINDPVGTQIKLQEYFEVFSADFGSVFEIFIPYTLLLSVFLCILEVVIGVALLMNYKIKIVGLIITTLAITALSMIQSRASYLAVGLIIVAFLFIPFIFYPQSKYLAFLNKGD